MTSHSPKPYGEHARKPKSLGFEFPVLTKESGKQRIAAVSSVESPLRRVRIRLRTPPPSLPEPRKPSSIEKRPFRRGSCRLFSTFPGLCRHNGLSGGFFGSGLCIQKFRSWRLDFEARRRPGIGCRKVSFARLRKPIADLIRGFRTVGSIPRERRAAARLRYPGANDLRPQL